VPRIRVPKPFLELITEVKPETFLLMGKYQLTNSQGKYFHWDEFKWRVEKGDDEVAAWTVTKLARKAIAKDLALQSEENRHFSYCVPNSLSAKLHSIDRMTGGGRKISDGLLLSTDEKSRYLVKSFL
jgi:hypothetical protein